MLQCVCQEPNLFIQFRFSPIVPNHKIGAGHFVFDWHLGLENFLNNFGFYAPSLNKSLALNRLRRTNHHIKLSIQR